MTLITVLVRSDATPELEERFTLTLVAIRTISAAISPGSGAATLDLQASTADITIRASNNPHGQVDFQTASLSVTVEEGQTRELIIVRQFGMFGEGGHEIIMRYWKGTSLHIFNKDYMICQSLCDVVTDCRYVGGDVCGREC